MARRLLHRRRRAFVVSGFTLARSVSGGVGPSSLGLQASALIQHGKRSPSAPTTPPCFLLYFNGVYSFGGGGFTLVVSVLIA